MADQRIVLIPAYKPGAEMLRTLRDLKNKDFQVIIVNDGSGAECDPIFNLAAQTAVVLSHPENRGKGQALKTGLGYIRDSFKSPFTVVTVDADGQHRPADILKVYEAAEASPDCLILGSRRFDKNVPFKSRFGNTVTRFVYCVSSKVNVFDTQTGLQAFSEKLIDKMLDIEGTRYEYEMNVLMEMPRCGVQIKEVRVETVYFDGNSSSHFDVLGDSCRIYREILKFSASSFSCFLVDYGLFCLLSGQTGMTVFSNISARICSSILNFNLNKRIVFRSKGRTLTSAVKYFTLAGVILVCNTALLKGLITIHINTYAAKLITEFVMFLFSYFIQRTFIFRKERLPE